MKLLLAELQATKAQVNSQVATIPALIEERSHNYYMVHVHPKIENQDKTIATITAHTTTEIQRLELSASTQLAATNHSLQELQFSTNNRLAQVESLGNKQYEATQATLNLILQKLSQPGILGNATVHTPNTQISTVTSESADNDLQPASRRRERSPPSVHPPLAHTAPPTNPLNHEAEQTMDEGHSPGA